MSTVPGRPDTRDRILDAARDLLVHHLPSSLSVQEIADAAGVSHRTVYRYFPDKDALIRAVAERPTDRVPELRWPESYPEAAGALRAFWRFFGEQLDDLRTERMLPGGVELRRARLPGARASARLLLRDAGVPEGPDLDGLVEVIVHLTSSSTLLELVDRHELTVDGAADLVLDAVDRLVRSALKEKP